MEGGGRRKWNRLRRQIALMGCCASDWGFRATEGGRDLPIDPDQTEAAGEVDLATALAVERRRRHRAVMERERASGGREEGDQARAPTLMKLLEEEERGDGEGSSGSDRWCCCCVCMGRRNGAAFIPCGHTFCRACAREMRAARGACPLCNRPIADVLDIF
ncbi:death-associated inhibitor of apoptosis 1-like [Zingiber officinale]|uniref:RING-type domain-containing protein n=1 Tax=Zingiber officinale TaxID=94328 RepID=A0A8J5C5D4_ZINOF|nr:death-associated inhibitor of apoptosis 1-like [Zingiber officinale]KAG6472900.1 hypothetical protein ZIOFF_070378 [Zingiber officinale]